MREIDLRLARLGRRSMLHVADDPDDGGRTSTALTMLNIAVLAPMPSASVRMATAANAGRRFQRRSAYRKFWRMASITAG